MLLSALDCILLMIYRPLSLIAATPVREQGKTLILRVLQEGLALWTGQFPKILTNPCFQILRSVGRRMLLKDMPTEG